MDSRVETALAPSSADAGKLYTAGARTVWVLGLT